jgi:hypothetical protein
MADVISNVAGLPLRPWQHHEIRFALNARPIPLQFAPAGFASTTYIDHPYFRKFVAKRTGNVTITYYRRASDVTSAVDMQLYDVTSVGAIASSSPPSVTTTGTWTVTDVTVAVVSGREYRLQGKSGDAAKPGEGHAELSEVV